MSAIGQPPQLDNPNLEPLDAASAFLIEASAEGLVRFDAAGQIEPGLAQSWIVSDDGMRYTFRLARMRWPDGSRMTAQQVAGRLQAARSRASRNPLKPMLGAIDEIMAMTDEVLEIALRSPRPNFLQMLAQPEMGILFKGQGAGPYRPTWQEDGTVLLTPPRNEEEEEEDGPPPILLKGERAALAIARFLEGEADLVIGGTIGDLPLARAARLGNDRLTFDPAEGLFGLAFTAAEGPLTDPAVRQALSMALDRDALSSVLAIPGLATRLSLVPTELEEMPRPAVPAWAGNPLPMRREYAAQTIGKLDVPKPIQVRVAMPQGPGYRILFARLKRDWAAIGVDAQKVAIDDQADLRFIDLVAPARLASWYLRRFSCDANPVCDPAADEAMAAARIAPNMAARRALLANADRLLAAANVFIPIATPIRWSLLSPRLAGFRPNMFARHYAGELAAPSP
ncbi:ABC transporter substrate-binding protein [Sphingosinicella sp. GR2756]|uniref:ABC transporter substrate-binding protein n=1 Tax=Sphingosinicella rhizophila TaxID=3050082 RepID=A0ABU3Q4T6_9SPHN|nr:ABC transporter substrate-binding protein [Sphingosinicella sp. GR2756]